MRLSQGLARFSPIFAANSRSSADCALRERQLPSFFRGRHGRKCGRRGWSIRIRVVRLPCFGAQLSASRRVPRCPSARLPRSFYRRPPNGVLSVRRVTWQPHSMSGIRILCCAGRRSATAGLRPQMPSPPAPLLSG